jgi:ribosomal protein S27E
MIALHNRSGHYVLMTSAGFYGAVCDGTVFAEIASFDRADANTACVSCGMTLVDSPFSGSDYFDVIMRVGRPIWRGARLRRAG